MKNFKLIASMLCLFVCSAFVSCESTEEPNTTDPSGGTDVEDNSYNCTVKYSDGTVVNDIRVQWCDAVKCFTPVATDANGVAKNNSLPDGNYGVHLYENDIPEGYTYDPNGHDVTATNRNAEITLYPVSTATSGDGTQANPYVITEGYYNVEIAQQREKVYFRLEATEACTYQIQSLALEKFAVNPMSLLISYDGKEYGSANKTNFNQEITMTAGQSKDLIMLIIDSSSIATAYPAEFSFQVTKK